LIYPFFLPFLWIVGGSSLWGSGAIGGSIHFESPIVYDKNWSFSWQSLTGSFQHFSNGGKIEYSNKKFSSRSRFFYEQAKNDFGFNDQNGIRRNLPNAQIKQKGFLQENAFRINTQQELKFHLWWQKSDRSIPPTIGQLQSKAQQEDEAIRALLHWQFNGAQSVWAIKTAYFDERLNYDDSLSNIHSKSIARVAQTQLEWTRAIGQNWQVNANAQHRFLWAESDAYLNLQKQHQLAFYASLKWQANKRWHSVLSTRQEWVDGNLSPFLPSLAFSGLLAKGLELKGSVSRNFRLPTFNDLYWSPGGNPDLKAEKGWSEELGLHYQTPKKTTSLGLTAYNRNIQDWIIWLPNGSFWSPQNILEVWSRGLELTLQQTFHFSSIQFSLNSHYNFTLSTNQKAKSSSDRSLGKQLIYQPKHQGQINLKMEWNKWNLSYHHQVTGKVFLLADHSADLPTFQVGNLQLSHTFKHHTINGRIQFNIRNIWNKDYQVVVNRPLPGRYFELGTTLNFNP